MISHSPLEQIRTGNLLLILCCVFYLAWWGIAFQPEGGIRGMRSGWLLIPAALAGAAGAALIMRGCWLAPKGAPIVPTGWIVAGGIAAYVVLAAGTRILLRRPVTTELFLIIGWAMLVLAELNALNALGACADGRCRALAVVTLVLTVICLICYAPYYKLSPAAGYVDGMIPLILAGIMMAVLTALI